MGHKTINRDDILSQEWSQYWGSKHRTISSEIQFNLDSHQGRITFDLLKENKPGERILEAGCGLGNWVFIFEKMGFRPTGIDLSFSAMQVAEEYTRKNNLNSHFLLGDVRNIPCKNNYFDVLVSYGVIEHFNNSKDALKEFYRVLKPGGSCLITTPNPFSFHCIIGRYILNITKSYKLGYLGYEKAFTPAGLTMLLREAHFKKIKCGILSEGMGSLFGVFWPIIPVIGKPLNALLVRIATYIERRQNLIGGGSYAIGYK